MIRCVALLLLCLAPAGQGGGVESVELAAPPGTQRVAFRLWTPPSADRPEGRELGWALWTRRGAFGRRAARTSLELGFPQEGIRVLHAEERRGMQQRLVWRELGPAGVRSVVLEVRGRRAVVRDLAPGLALRRDRDWRGEDRLPLAFVLDLLGGGPSGARCFSPLSCTQETVTGRALAVPGSGLTWVVLGDVERPRGWWLFAGNRPLAFQIEAGGPIATACPAADLPEVGGLPERDQGAETD